MIFDYPPPAIIQSEPWELQAHEQMARLGIPRRIRRAIIVEAHRLFSAKPAIQRATLDDMRRFAGVPAGAMLFTPPIGWGASGAAPASISFLNTYSDTTTQTTYTFNSVNFGTASAGRYIIISYMGGSGTRTVSSATIGGVSATKFGEVQGGTHTTGFLIAAVPTGTSGTVVITWSASQARTSIASHEVLNLSSTTPTATATGSLSGNAYSASLTIDADGFGIGSAFTTNSGLAVSWTNLTEVFEFHFPDDRIHSGATSSTAGSATRTATFTGAPGSNSGLSLAALR